MQQVTDNVFVETGFTGCNTGFVVTAEGVIVVDTPQLPTQAAQWREEAGRHGPLRFLINTEHHGDHITGNYFFPTMVVAHQLVREAFVASPPTARGLRDMVQQMDPQGLPLIGSYQARLPTITFSQRLTLYLGEHTFELIHLPGHTAGQTAVVVPQERVAFTGDNIFHRSMPFLMDARVFDWLESLKRIGELDVDHLVPGHGEVCDRAYLAEFGAFLQEWIDAVQGAIAQGWTKEEAAARISFLDRFPMFPGMEAFGPELQRMNVLRVYEELLARQEA